MNKSAITPSRLEAIAETVNAEHAVFEAAMRESLARAVRIGTLLTEAKSLVNHGEWLPWLAGHCTFSERTAQNYMRLADRYPELTKSATVADLTYRDAIALLAEPKHDPERSIGRALLSDPTIYRYCEKWWNQDLGWLVDYLLEDGYDILSTFMAWDKMLAEKGRTLNAELNDIVEFMTSPEELRKARGLELMSAGWRAYVPDVIIEWASRRIHPVD